MIQAVILAGGEGKRLRPLTTKTPKSMVLIRRKPFLYHLLRHLKKIGFKNILICTGYMSEKIVNYFGGGKKLGLNIKYSVDGKNLQGTGGALKNAQPFLSKEFLLINGDTYLPIDYSNFIKFAHKKNKLGTIIFYKNSKRENKNPKPIHAGTGLYKKSITTFIPRNKRFSLEKELFPILVQKKQLGKYITNQKFYDIGTPYRLRIIEKILK